MRLGAQVLAKEQHVERLARGAAGLGVVPHLNQFTNQLSPQPPDALQVPALADLPQVGLFQVRNQHGRQPLDALVERPRLALAEALDFLHGQQGVADVDDPLRRSAARRGSQPRPRSSFSTRRPSSGSGSPSSQYLTATG